MYRGFPLTLVPLLACQTCGGGLRSDAKGVSHVQSGVFVCTKCMQAYTVTNGILEYIGDKELDSKLQSEIAARDNEAKGYDKRLRGRYAKEVRSTLRPLGNLTGKYVLEQGCGTGRLTTEYAVHARGVLACDFSLASLRVLAQKDIAPQVGLIHADATQLRVAPGAFNVVLATQFYEHIPTRALRTQFLEHTHNALTIGGIFVSTTYHYDLRMRLRHATQEGMHSGEIFYHYYTSAELAADFDDYFRIESITPIDITLPLEERLHLPVAVRGWLSRVAEHLPLLNQFGHLLLAVTTRVR